MAKTYKNFFKPLNPGKYKGDHTNIVYRSRWEAMMMSEFDKDPSVVSWSSEEVIVLYRDPFDVRIIRRYFPDFVIEKRQEDGSIKKIMIEVKPHKETILPKVKGKRLLKEQHTYVINQAKWQAAREFCEKRNMEFEIITEKNRPFTFGRNK